VAPENLHLLSSIPFDHLVNFCAQPVGGSKSGSEETSVFCTRGMWGSSHAATSRPANVGWSSMGMCGTRPSRTTVSPKSWGRRGNTFTASDMMLPEETKVTNCMCINESIDINSAKETDKTEVEKLFNNCPIMRSIRIDTETSISSNLMSDLGDVAPDVLEMKIFALRDIPDQTHCKTIRPKFLVRYGSASVISRRLKPGSTNPNIDVTVDLPFTGRKYIYLDILESTIAHRCEHLGSVCVDLSDVKFIARRKLVEVTNVANKPCGYIFVELKYRQDPFSGATPKITVNYSASDNIAAEATRLYAGSPRANATSPIEKVCDFSSCRTDDDFDKHSPNARTAKIALSSAANLPNPFPFKKYDVYCAMKVGGTCVDTPIVSRAGCDPLFNYLIEFPVADSERKLEFEIFGLHPFGGETLLARCSIPLSEVKLEEENRFHLPMVSEYDSKCRPILNCTIEMERTASPYAVVKKLENILPRSVEDVF